MKNKLLFLLILINLQPSSGYTQDSELDINDGELDSLLSDFEEDGEDDNLAETASDDDIDVGAKAGEDEDDLSSLEGELEEIDFDNEGSLKEEKAAKLDDNNDDLDDLEDDLDELDIDLPEDEESEVREAKAIDNEENPKKSKVKIAKDGDLDDEEAKVVFEVGRLEKELLDMAKNMQGKICLLCTSPSPRD